MREQLTILSKLIDNIDNDPTRSLKYFNNSGAPVDCKMRLMQEALHNIEHNIKQSNDCDRVDQNVGAMFDILEHIYQTTQNLCWRSHEHHFHPTFENYVNCPVTCLGEIVEYLDKIIKEKYSDV